MAVKVLVEYPPLVLVQGAAETVVSAPLVLLQGDFYLTDCRRVGPWVACLVVARHLRGRGLPRRSFLIFPPWF